MKQTILQAGSSCITCAATTLMVILLFTATAMPGAVQAAGFQTDGITLKTKPANKQRIKPLVDAVASYESELRKTGGKPPADAGMQMQKIRSLAGPAKGEIRSLAARLRANNEIEAFDEYINKLATQAGIPNAANDLASSGGAYAMLMNAGSIIDDLLGRMEKGGQQHTTADYLFDWLGIREAHAVLCSTCCGVFWWMLSAGYGTTHAYYSCYNS
jgi:hypothetical protein